MVLPYGSWLRPRENQSMSRKWRTSSTPPDRSWLADLRQDDVVIKDCEERYEEGPRQLEDWNHLVYGNLDPYAKDSKAEGFADGDSLRKDLVFNSVH